MTLKVAYLECTGDLWPEIAEIMKRESDWQPVDPERRAAHVPGGRASLPWRRFPRKHFRGEGPLAGEGITSLRPSAR